MSVHATVMVDGKVRGGHQRLRIICIRIQKMGERTIASNALCSSVIAFRLIRQIIGLYGFGINKIHGRIHSPANLNVFSRIFNISSCKSAMRTLPRSFSRRADS